MEKASKTDMEEIIRNRRPDDPPSWDRSGLRRTVAGERSQISPLKRPKPAPRAENAKTLIFREKDAFCAAKVRQNASFLT